MIHKRVSWCTYIYKSICHLVFEIGLFWLVSITKKKRKEKEREREEKLGAKENKN